MNAVKASFEAAIAAGFDLIHVDPTVDINVPKGEVIDIHLVVRRTVELIEHCEKFRRANNYPEISYEVGTEEVHGGLADDTTFDTFLVELKEGLAAVGLSDVWPCFIVGKVGTDLQTSTPLSLTVRLQRNSLQRFVHLAATSRVTTLTV